MARANSVVRGCEALPFVASISAPTDLDAKWAGNKRDAVNFIRMAYNSFKRS